MTKIKVNNQAWAQLAASITDSDTLVEVVDASLFPVLAVDEYFYGTLVNLSNQIEIVKVTEITGNDLTIERGAEGTTPRPFTTTDRIEQRVTAQTIVDLYLQNSVDAAASEANALAAAAVAVSSNIRSVKVSGASARNALVATSSPALGSYTKELMVMIELEGHAGNNIPNPTLELDNLGPKTIYRGAGDALQDDDTSGSTAKKFFAFSEDLDGFLLVNPANALVDSVDNGQLTADSVQGSAGSGNTNVEAESIDEPDLATNSISNRVMQNNSIGKPEMQNSAVGQPELNTASGAQLMSLSLGSDIDRIILSGGRYSFYPRTGITIHAGTWDPQIQLFRSNGGTIGIATYLTYYGSLSIGESGQAVADNVYVLSSPPFNMGNGDIPLFIFLKVANDGTVKSASVEQAPCWAYNGPTDIEAQREAYTYNDDGEIITTRKYRNVIDPDAGIILPPWKGGDPNLWDQATAEAYASAPMVEVEIDQDLKNADMGVIPHPFIDLANDDTVVLVDPCSPLVDSLLALHKSGENIGLLFNQGYLELTDNVGCNVPPGVVAKAARWKP